MDSKEIRSDGVDLVHVPLSKDQWRAVMNTVMKLLGSIKGGKCLDQMRYC